MDKSFTVKADRLLRILSSEVQVSESFDPAEGVPEPLKICVLNAFWDTGATESVITQRVIDSCGLKPVRSANVHGVHGMQKTEIYMVNMYLPNQVGFFKVPVFKGHHRRGGWDLLLGMDILATGDFSVKNVGGKTEWSFSVPSDYPGLIT